MRDFSRSAKELFVCTQIIFFVILAAILMNDSALLSKKICFFATILCFSTLTLQNYAESFRVHKLHNVELAGNFETKNIKIGINDAICVNLPGDMTFIDGIEVSMKVPQIIAEWSDTVVYSAYENLNPAPSEEKIDYSGNRLSVHTIPGRLSHIINIPLKTETEIKESPYAYLLTDLQNIAEKFVFLRFQLAMKGVPESFESAMFDINIKPILLNKGKLSLNISSPEKSSVSDEVSGIKQYSVYIDEKLITNNPEYKGILLETGEHHLALTSESYRNEVRTFRIEQAAETKLQITLKGIEPEIKIVSPENAAVFFDNEPLENIKTPFITTPGEHSVKFIIGDYEVVKNFSVVNGRTYTVNLDINASVTED